MDGAGDQTFARARLSREEDGGQAPPLLSPREKASDLSRTASKVALSPTRSASGSIAPLRVSLLLNSLLSFVPLDHCPPPLTIATG